ncbi:glucose-6-phosphate 1-dehydrogenase [Microbacteriaceae bacterium SG_E_30_P1]|uniref:Glucose-6-phosphate 1-dehydrogenase n=1 Tax=Antiquaquibacter oligotrophicus TaxID=2880260 RepID=A0ABT6KMT2_9MICO|nr:glucose-6-phosphate dehydrogenase [Antiquaquibacter oligotrophicus]MDH6181323.1 glucose-6-phosphate 1-dehydrogenase [Antiquaquibacter oligotrophicus]UDF12984.1 glucose-6-phosphate dehydrogenase [Antiquaquibacter oligotrophicus]
MTSRIDTLVILGAGGDLTSRLLLPGIASYLASRDAQSVEIIGVDREDFSAAQWHKRISTAFASAPSALGTRVADASSYLRGDATNPDDLARVLAAAKGRVALYFALPPAVAELACRALSTMTLPAGITLVLEKPFGTDLRSAAALNRLLQTMVPEKQIFRVDHFLGKSTVLNLIGLRFANRIFEPLFSRDNVEKVEIIADESLGLEHRAGYYDHAGALEDMIQSHLLLVLALAAMEPPASLDAEDLRGSMAQVLRATRPWRKNGTSSRRARYGAGSVDGRRMPAYIDEDGVDPRRKTETLAQVTLAIDNWRWEGVPFIVRSGKALAESRQEVIVTFKEVPHLPAGLTGVASPSRLRVSLKPATLDLDLVVNGEGDPFTLDQSILHAELGEAELSAYGEVLADVLEGSSVISVRGDVAEQCWRIVEPVMKAWSKDLVPLETYPAGSLGPSEW